MDHSLDTGQYQKFKKLIHLASDLSILPRDEVRDFQEWYRIQVRAPKGGKQLMMDSLATALKGSLNSSALSNVSPLNASKISNAPLLEQLTKTLLHKKTTAASGAGSPQVKKLTPKNDL